MLVLAVLASGAFASTPRPISATPVEGPGDAARSAVDGRGDVDRVAAMNQDTEADPPALYDPLVVREVAFTLSDSDWAAIRSCGRDSAGGDDRKADMVIDGERLSEVGVRCKGNSSLSIGSTKKPLNVTTDAFVPGQDLWGFDVINFNNNWSDPSLLREAIMLTALSRFAPVPRFTFARVTANGEYVGD
jgi:spore coat protein CotH